MCAQRGFTYTRFEGVNTGKFQGYVAWNTARKAWEHKKFELDVVPKGWVRTTTSMTGTSFPSFSAFTCSIKGSLEKLTLTYRRYRIRHYAPPSAHPHLACNFPAPQRR
jgi:hypothetical protein